MGQTTPIVGGAPTGVNRKTQVLAFLAQLKFPEGHDFRRELELSAQRNQADVAVGTPVVPSAPQTQRKPS